jgi:hypothetical protein
VAAAGYFVYGDAVDTNIVLTVKNTTLVTMANMLLAVHLILAFLIIINPVCQELEEIFQVPHRKYAYLCVLQRDEACYISHIFNETVLLTSCN